jgi:glutaminyl-peptide cyclotransferase
MQRFDVTVDPILVPRVVGTPNHALVRQYIIGQMQSLGWDIETDKFTADAPRPHGKKTFENIITTLDPKAQRRLVLACHYDSKYTRDGNFIGATDSAVPCAMMITLAKDLAPKLDQLKNSVSRLFSFKSCIIKVSNYSCFIFITFRAAKLLYNLYFLMVRRPSKIGILE